MAERRFPSLAHWGAFTAVVEDGRVVRCEPFEHDPTPSAMLSSMPAMVHSPLRIARPAIRKGWLDGNRERTGHNDFVEVPWDEALDRVSAELARVRRDHGDAAIFGGSYGWSSAGRLHHARTLVRRFLFLGGGCTDQGGNYSWGAAQFILPHVIGTYQPVAGQVTDWNSIIDNSRLVLAFGGLALKNGQVASGGSGAHTLESWLHKAKAAGIEFVVISPNRADAPDFLDAQWVPIRPNTDTALMLAMAQVLVAEDRHDAAFMDTHCVGFPQFRRYLEGGEDGTPKTPEWAAAITGIDAATIRALARRAADVRTLITSSWSLQRAHHGEQPYWATIVLAAMLGGIGVPGGGFAFGHGSLNGVGNPRPDLPGPEVPMPPNPAGSAIPVARITDMLENPGGRYSFNGRDSVYPDIRLIYWAGGNPFHHHQDLNRLVQAWTRPETVIVHESWWTPLARRADIVLPATTTLERNDVGGSSRDNFVLAMHKAIAPVGDARDDFEIFRALAARAGFEQEFTRGLDEMGWCRMIYDTFREGCAHKGIAMPVFEEFWDRGFVKLPPRDKDFILFEDFRRDPERNPLRTPSGRIEIFSQAIHDFGYADCPPHPTWIEPAEWLGSTIQHRWPIHLVTNQPADRLHSQLDPGPLSRSHKVGGRERIRMNPADAGPRGLASGDTVRLYNGRGACLAGLEVDDAIAPGVAVMATGAWFDPGGAVERRGNPNVLTLDIGTSQLAQGPSALSVLVEIERWNGGNEPIGMFAPPSFVNA